MKTLMVARRELGAYFNAPVAYIVVGVFLLSSAFLFFSRFFVENQASMQSYFDIAPYLMSFFAPALAMRLLAEDRNTNTIEALLTLPIKDSEVVLGKFLAALGVLAVALGLTLAYPVSVSLFGELDRGPLIGGYLGLFFLGAGSIGIGLLASTWTRSQLVAFILGWALCSLFSLMSQAAAFLPSALQPLLQYLALPGHLANMARGLIDTRDLVYDASIIVGSLGLALYSLAGTRRKQTAKRSRDTLALVLLFGALLVVNIAAARLFVRFDVTSDRLYTLSPASKELVAGLQSTLHVKAYMTKDPPAKVAHVARYVRDLLEEYRLASQGHFEWDVVDPTADPKSEEDAKLNRIPRLRLQEVSRDQMAVRAVYLGLVLEYGNQSERIPAVSDEAGFEYEISSAIKALASTKKKIAIASCMGCLEPATDKGLEGLKAGLREYNFVSVAMGDQAEKADSRIPDDAEALLVWGPKYAFSESTRREIDRYLMLGKAAGFMIDGLVFEPENKQLAGETIHIEVARVNAPGLGDLVAPYGFHIDENVVLDEQNLLLPVPVGGRVLRVNQPLFPVATRLANHPATRGLKGLILPFSSSVALTGNRKQGGAEGTLVPLAISSPNAWKTTGAVRYDPESPNQRQGAEPGTSVFGYAYEGRLASAFNKVAESSAEGESRGPVRLVVMGGSNFANDEILRNRGLIGAMVQSNWLFMLNLVNWLARDESLISLRSKLIASRPLTVRSARAPKLVRFGNILGLPLGFWSLGLWYWRRRRHRLGQRAQALMNRAST